ncbi:reverse transcriptase family protein [Flintibacter faecis]|uniref:RNA-directed DNA polymerase n=1 Tax=Flintibacter faecis TaxID=2763047 RepID=A0A8J6IX07_9FIRM|nr:reverse transcriptase family protein [Flintibacter faecis]MBC5715840.1 RNA-directed DNA polymerase [Flintibacter faecis]
MVCKSYSDLERLLGISVKALYSVSNASWKHYRSVKIPKNDRGEFRELHVPDEFLKTVQRRIADRLLSAYPVSPYATAYRPGGSTIVNARPHVGKNVLLKLDIHHFFDNILYATVKEKAFPAEDYSESIRILLTILCVHKDALPQGAPTSPVISNIIMRDFDCTVGGWCDARGIAYTRYCDDMTFSGDFDSREVVSLVRTELRKMGLFLNEKKTVRAVRGQRQSVTGLVVNEGLRIPAAYRKKLRQEVYYCRKFGVAAHLQRMGSGERAEEYLPKLLGRINYACSVMPDDQELRQERRWVMQQLHTLER